MIPALSRPDNWPGRVRIAIAGLLALVAIWATGCTSADKATEALKAEGFTAIRIEGWSAFSCSEDDGTCTAFSAVGPTGHRVSGAVGCGYFFKGCTVRITGAGQ